MGNKTRVMDRSSLKIADLKARQPAQTNLMNVKIPGNILDQVKRIAGELETSKTQVVVALLEAGLEEMGKVKRK